jgi:flavin prenyltransferase
MKVLVGITGASGIRYGTRLAEVLREITGVDCKIVISKGALEVARADGDELPKADYEDSDFSCPYASGSNPPDAIVIVPCSLNTLGKIASGIGDSLILRAAQVALKERRKLVLVPRETPYSLITIKNMETITLAGGIILPASPGFYGNPQEVEDLVDFVAARILDQLGIAHRLGKRWMG